MKTLFSFLFLWVSFSSIAKNSISVTEKIFLATDRDIYVAGETILFSIHLMHDGTETAPSNYAYMVLRDEQNKVISGICMKLNNQMFSGGVYLPDTLKTGKYQMVTYTNCMRNDERSFTTKEIIIANRFDKDLSEIADSNSNTRAENPESFLSLYLPKRNYANRQKVRLTITSPENDSVSNLSVSVRQASPHIYSSDNSPFQDISSSFSYISERKGIIIEGKIMSQEDQHPVPDATVYLSVPDTIPNLLFTKTDQNGIFLFQLNDSYTVKTLFIRLPEGIKANIELDNKYDIRSPFKPDNSYPSGIKNYINKSQEVVQIQKVYGSVSNKEINKQYSGSPTRVYGPVDKTKIVYPSDFQSLPDFVEISRELLPFLKTRKHKNEYVASILDENMKAFFDDPPLVFLDGVPLEDIDQIIQLGSDKISKIETVPALRYFGDIYFKGILAVFTKKQEIYNVKWKNSMLATNLVSYHPASDFISNDYSNDQRVNHTPDFRQELYWNPSLQLRNKTTTVEFFTSDLSGDFEIVAEGISRNGTPIKSKTYFTVQNTFKK